MSVSYEQESSRSSARGRASAPSGEYPSEGIVEAYAGDAAEELPIGGYATMLGIFASAFVGLVLVARKTQRPERHVSTRDIVLGGIATHKLSRTVTRERVTIPLRAPFTHYEGTDGAGQVRERPRGHGLQRAVGSLLTCQYCTGAWVATALTAGFVLAPRATRLATALLTMATVSDFLHQAYAGARRWSR
jgi:hypothetical protein